MFTINPGNTISDSNFESDMEVMQEQCAQMEEQLKQMEEQLKQMEKQLKIQGQYIKALELNTQINISNFKEYENSTNTFIDIHNNNFKQVYDEQKSYKKLYEELREDFRLHKHETEDKLREILQKLKFERRT